MNHLSCDNLILVVFAVQEFVLKCHQEELVVTEEEDEDEMIVAVAVEVEDPGLHTFIVPYCLCRY